MKTKPTVPCPDCKGIGTVARSTVAAEEGHFDPAYASRNFPALCDKCSGSGRASAPPPPPPT